MTFETARTMTNDEIEKRIKELSFLMGICSGTAWKVFYKECSMLEDILTDRFGEGDEADFIAFYENHIKGKRWEEIDQRDWAYYSDWYKEIYGFRPKHI